MAADCWPDFLRHPALAEHARRHGGQLASGNARFGGEILNDLPRPRFRRADLRRQLRRPGYCCPFSGYWAAILALLTAYVGTLGQAVGARREYGGIMSKPWRMVVLGIGAWTTFAAMRFQNGNIHWGPLTILDWTCMVVIAGCLQTMAIRLKRIFATLSRTG